MGQHKSKVASATALRKQLGICDYPNYQAEYHHHPGLSQQIGHQDYGDLPEGQKWHPYQVRCFTCIRERLAVQ